MQSRYKFVWESEKHSFYNICLFLNFFKHQMVSSSKGESRPGDIYNHGEDEVFDLLDNSDKTSVLKRAL